MRKICFSLLFGLWAGVLVASDRPEDAAQAVFDQLTALRISGLPSADQQAQLRDALSPALNAALDEARDWQQQEIERMAREAPDDKPPMIEGDFFSSLFEGAHSAEVESARSEGARSVVTLTRSYQEDGSEAIQWTDRAVMIEVDGRWLLDDVEYSADWAFKAGNQSLRKTLQATMSDE